jgi:hypothetical protein
MDFIMDFLFPVGMTLLAGIGAITILLEMIE